MSTTKKVVAELVSQGKIPYEMQEEAEQGLDFELRRQLTAFLRVTARAALGKALLTHMVNSGLI